MDAALGLLVLAIVESCFVTKTVATQDHDDNKKSHRRRRRRIQPGFLISIIVVVMFAMTLVAGSEPPFPGPRACNSLISSGIDWSFANAHDLFLSRVLDSVWENVMTLICEIETCVIYV